MTSDIYRPPSSFFGPVGAEEKTRTAGKAFSID